MGDIHHHITHSGKSWVCLGHSNKNGECIWPIEEYIARNRHKKKIADRIERLNPDGKEEGKSPKGWHPKQRSSRRIKKAKALCAL